MKWLLDTHVWLWSLVAPQRIPAETRSLLTDPKTELYLSAASSWEIAIKYRLGKLPLPEPPALFIPPRLVRDGILSLAVEHLHAQAVADLPDYHKDPFDRLLLAQAAIENMTLITADVKLKPYGIPLRCIAD